MTGEKYIDVDGIKTRYFDKGSGPVVVLFHGGHFGFHDAADCAEDWSLNFDGSVRAAPGHRGRIRWARG